MCLRVYGYVGAVCGMDDAKRDDVGEVEDNKNNGVRDFLCLIY